MKPVSPAQRLAAAALSVSVTFLLVWTFANLGYPAQAAALVALACR
jgi:hypothetical protein